MPGMHMAAEAVTCQTKKDNYDSVKLHNVISNHEMVQPTCYVQCPSMDAL